MKTVYAKHEPYENGHLGEVTAEMKLAGAPTIRAMEFDDKLVALEGSHRLAAAHYLGLEPKIVLQEQDGGELTEHWRRVVDSLPAYAYEHIHVLDLTKIADR